VPGFQQSRYQPFADNPRAARYKNFQSLYPPCPDGKSLSQLMQFDLRMNVGSAAKILPLTGCVVATEEE
jgi:hypothetical protein